MTYCYRSTGLTYVGIVARVAFKLVYSAVVGIFMFCASCWCTVFVGRKATFILVRLKRLVTLCTEGL